MAWTLPGEKEPWTPLNQYLTINLLDSHVCPFNFFYTYAYSFHH